MRILAASLIYLPYASALDCYTCTAKIGENDNPNTTNDRCWHSSTTAVDNQNPAVVDPSNSVTCGVSVTQCFATIETRNGLPYRITRGCEQASVATESGTICTLSSTPTTYDYYSGVAGANAVQTQTCKKHCTTDRCNSDFNPAEFKSCQKDFAITTKWCDHTDGNYYCKDDSLAGTGLRFNNPLSLATQNVECTTTAATTTTRTKCVQCNSDIDTTCWTKNTATDCADGQTMCSAQTLTLFDKDSGVVLHEKITKSCTSGLQPSADQCHWTDSLDGANFYSDTASMALFHTNKEFKTNSWGMPAALVCSSVCDPTTDNTCNAPIPNGKMDDTKESGVFCASNDGSGTDLQLKTADWTNKIIKCPAKDSAGVAITGCYSKVSYMMRPSNIHENKMGSELVKIIKHERGCMTSTMTITAGCTSTATSTSPKVTGLAVNIHTCQSTCTGDACNNLNWPTRVKCIQDTVDNSIVDTTRQAAMKKTGMLAFPCPTPAHTACAITEANILGEDNLYNHFYKKKITYGLANNAMMQGDDDVTNLGFVSETQRMCLYDASDITVGCSETGRKGTSDWNSGIDNWDKYRQNILSCNKTCTEDGCNWGSAMNVKSKYLGVLEKNSSPSIKLGSAAIVAILGLLMLA